MTAGARQTLHFTLWRHRHDCLGPLPTPGCAGYHLSSSQPPAALIAVTIASGNQSQRAPHPLARMVPESEPSPRIPAPEIVPPRQMPVREVKSVKPATSPAVIPSSPPVAEFGGGGGRGGSWRRVCCPGDHFPYGRGRKRPGWESGPGDGAPLVGGGLYGAVHGNQEIWVGRRRRASTGRIRATVVKGWTRKSPAGGKASNRSLFGLQGLDTSGIGIRPVAKKGHLG